jgi:hypothetical protein
MGGRYGRREGGLSKRNTVFRRVSFINPHFKSRAGENPI